jgi:hypothetical protein
VQKHWRQQWVYQDPSIHAYSGRGSWTEQRFDAAAVAGRWSQAVYQVDDSPRYEALGDWVHQGNYSAWTSDQTWRPLPRREYTKRDDYQLLNVENRHTITPQGWTHEQDNTKVQRGADGVDHVLVREIGFNDYRRIRGYDFSPGTTYWKKTAPFWAQVRARWQAALASPDGVTLGYPTDDEAFIGTMFEIAEAYAENAQLDAAMTRVDELFVASVNAPALTASTPPQASTPTDAPARKEGDTGY